MSTLTTSAPAPAVFSFDSHSVRTLLIDDQPWFVAVDVCDAFGIHRTQTRRLDDDEKGVRSVHTPSGEQEMAIINESGLYSLVLGSRKPEAKRFKKWVTSEVLPAIRKTGRYEAATTVPPAPSLLNRRWLLVVAPREGEMARPLDPEHFLTKVDEFPKMLRDPAFDIDGDQLAEIAHACTDRMASKLAGRANRVSV